MKKKTKKKSNYMLVHAVAEEFIKLVTRLEKKLGKTIQYNFKISK